jgi:hypothetical protein
VWNHIIPEIQTRYLSTYGFGPENTGIRHFMIVFLLVFLAAVAVSLFRKDLRRDPAQRVLLVLLAIHVGFLAFFNDYNPTEYMVFVVPLFASLLGRVFLWCWSMRPQYSSGLAVALCTLLLLNVGAVLYRTVKSDYRANYLPAVRFMQSHGYDTRFIMADASLAYELGFDKNLIDDVNLGYHTGKRAEVIVVNSEYELQFEMIRAKDQVKYGYIEKMLAEEYDKVYDQSRYKVYVARPALGELAGALGEAPPRDGHSVAASE